MLYRGAKEDDNAPPHNPPSRLLLRFAEQCCCEAASWLYICQKLCSERPTASCKLMMTLPSYTHPRCNTTLTVICLEVHLGP